MVDLFDFVEKKQNTSKMAFDSMKPHLSKIYKKILFSLHQEGKSTDDNLELRLEMSHQSLSACRRHLVKKGYVEETGDTKPTRSGRKAKVWKITESGIVTLCRELK